MIFFLVNLAQAVPLPLTQQGRLLDPNGAAIEGNEQLTFRLYDSPTGGNVVWEEQLSVAFNNGYYATILGSDELNNPLDASSLSLYPPFPSQVASNAPMTPRQPPTQHLTPRYGRPKTRRRNRQHDPTSNQRPNHHQQSKDLGLDQPPADGPTSQRPPRSSRRRRQHPALYKKSSRWSPTVQSILLENDPKRNDILRVQTPSLAD